MRVDYVKGFQEINNVFEALATYNEYNEEYMEDRNDLQQKISVIQESEGIYWVAPF